MLDVMRSNAKSSLTVLLFGAIIVVFVLQFGQGSKGLATRGTETWAAKVNGETVTASEFEQAYANRYRQMSQMRGGKYTTENAQQDNLKNETLKGLVDQELIAQQGQELGIAVSDQELGDAIAKNPNFQQEGKFDFEYYKRLVENGYGMSVPRFEDAYRKDLLRQKALEAVFNGATVTDDEVKSFWIGQHESAGITYVKFTSFMFRDKGTVTDAEAEAWAKDHAKEIEDAYNKDKATRWTQPPAVKVRAITVSLAPTAAPEAEKAARARIDAAYAEVKGGKDFAEVAKEKSEDSLTKLQGGDLGFVSKGGSAYGRTLEEEALKLKKGDLSPVFKDRTGFHFLKAEDTRPGREQPLDEVKKQIATDLLRAQKAKDLAQKAAQDALAQVKAGKDLKDLFPAAKPAEPGQFDMSSFTTPKAAEADAFHPLGGYVPGVGLAPKLSAAVFSLNEPGATPAAPVEDGEAFYVFKLKSRERADVSKLTDAEKKTAREQLEGQRQRELYTSWIERLRKGSKIVENQRLLSYEAGTRSDTFNPDDY